MKKKTLIILTIITVEHVGILFVMRKTLDALQTLNNNKLLELNRTAFTDGWKSGVQQGRVEGRREIIESRNSFEN
jgi:hypothetical protein